ncbi:MAG TPA: endonuclease domain-containing protein [Sphingomicrobium sp.]|nr:endonuclease domain-containing protein [Sphingomicrobium sp.]
MEVVANRNGGATHPPRDFAGRGTVRSMVEGFFLSVHQARNLRKRMTPPEVMLWSQLRRRPADLQFRRQHPCGPFVFDFFCRSAALAIEIDGFAHECGDNPQRDARRDLCARKQGIETIRIPAVEVKRNLEGILIHIVERCLERTPPPHCVRSPSPRNRGEND